MKALWTNGSFNLFRRSLEQVNKDVQPTKPQLQTAARTVFSFRDAGNWGIGDLVVIAELAGRTEPVDEIAEELVRDRTMVRKCYYTSKAIAPAERVFELWWTFYHLVYTFPEDVRRRLLKLAEEHHWTLEEFKTHLRSLRHSVRTEMQSFPPGEYGLIYADPPWKHEQGGADADTRGYRGVSEVQYPVMDLDEIKALTDPTGRPISKVASENCILYLWGTTALLPDALEVMQAWGFEYKSSMVWVKDIQGLGFWARSRHEFLLIGTRGDVIPPKADLVPDSVIQEPRGEHSEKPAAVYDMLERLYSKLPKIELFARGTQVREGWDVWGNQAPVAPVDALAEPTDEDNVTEPDVEQRDRETGKKKKAAKSAKTDAKNKPSLPRLVKQSNLTASA